MINTVKAHWKKLLGILWLFVAYTLVARAIALFRVDALDLPKHDPSSLEFWFGLFNVMLSLPYLLCAAGLLAKWRGNLRWVVLPALLLFVAAYSLRVTLGWHAA
jgi:hypothetical protein